MFNSIRQHQGQVAYFLFLSTYLLSPTIRRFPSAQKAFPPYSLRRTTLAMPSLTALNQAKTIKAHRQLLIVCASLYRQYPQIGCNTGVDVEVDILDLNHYSCSCERSSIFIVNMIPSRYREQIEHAIDDDSFHLRLRDHPDERQEDDAEKQKLELRERIQAVLRRGAGGRRKPAPHRKNHSVSPLRRRRRRRARANKWWASRTRSSSKDLVRPTA